mmetsp:Transcript_6962/g.23963  ORF Transcript_6962/g.23963 Transcript_6962/m.23963 type:complete len:492 (+) Transcript_6962:1135-2610(+)
MVLGQRGHDLRVVADEGRVHALGLEVLGDELIDHPRRGVWGGALHPSGGELLDQILPGLLGLKRQRDLDAVLLEAVEHGNSLEGRGKVDLHRVLVVAVGMVLHLVRPGHLEHHLGDHLLGHRHQVIVIRVGLVELHRGELGVVSHVNAFVTELPANLVHAVHSSNDEHLQVQLGGDAHEEVHVEVVVVRDEGLGGRASRDHVHHGSLHLDEFPLVQERAHELDNLAPGDEGVPALGVDHEVQVALPVPRLLVLEPDLSGGGHVQARRQHEHILDEDGELPALGLSRDANDSHNVSPLGLRVLGVEPVILALPAPQVGDGLDLKALALDVVKVELGTGRPLDHDPSSNRDGDPLELLAVLRLVGVLGDVVLDAQVHVELVRVRVLVRGLLVLHHLEPICVVLSGVELLVVRLLLLRGLRLRRLGRGLLCCLLRLLRGLLALLELALAQRVSILVLEILVVLVGQHPAGVRHLQSVRSFASPSLSLSLPVAQP